MPNDLSTLMVQVVCVAVKDAFVVMRWAWQHEFVDGQADFWRQMDEERHCCDVDEFGSRERKMMIIKLARRAKRNMQADEVHSPYT